MINGAQRGREQTKFSISPTMEISHFVDRNYNRNLTYSDLLDSEAPHRVFYGEHREQRTWVKNLKDKTGFEERQGVTNEVLAVRGAHVYSGMTNM